MLNRSNSTFGQSVSWSRRWGRDIPVWPLLLITSLIAVEITSLIAVEKLESENEEGFGALAARTAW
jgi:hypothetical protein